MKLFTIGYEQRTPDQFFAALRDQGVQTLVDVRLTPLSRKRGFSKTALRNACEALGIRYEHRRELGNPKVHRTEARSVDGRFLKPHCR